MTTTQKIHYLRQFESLLNILDENTSIPIGIVASHESDSTKMGFCPFHFGPELPVPIEGYGILLHELANQMMTGNPSKVVNKTVNPRNQNLN